MPQIFTVGQLADDLGVKVHRVIYAIQKLNIQPVHETGNARIFDESARDRLREAFDAKRAA